MQATGRPARVVPGWRAQGRHAPRPSPSECKKAGGHWRHQTQICRATGGSRSGRSPRDPRAGVRHVARDASPPGPRHQARGPGPGSGSSYVNVPELWFTPACANHDRCYGAHQGKAACDTAFLNDMLAICANVGSRRQAA